ncbi:MAG: hypothetical protein H6811_06455 [Phycisphaeraceae bacterium]|nr:hypothetical protein [Phycisphaeraceae bacterium]
MAGLLGRLLLVLTCLAACSPTQRNAPETPSQEQAPMAGNPFEPMMRAHDWSAVQLAQGMGPSAVSQVRPFLTSGDEVQRLLAVDCVAAAGGKDAPDILLQMAADPYEQVRGNASVALNRLPPVGRSARIGEVYDGTRRDDFVRRQLAMVLGRVEDKDAGRVLTARLESPDIAVESIEVVDALVAALARRGDAPSRTRFALHLSEARGKRIASLVDLSKYIDQPWLIRAWGPVLANRDIALVLATHEITVERRACDLAVDEIARLSQRQFTFPIAPYGQYRPEQIAEVRTFAAQQP